MIMIVGGYFYHCFYIDSFDGRVVYVDKLPSSMKHSGSVWPQVEGKKLLDPPTCVIVIIVSLAVPHCDCRLISLP